MFTQQERHGREEGVLRTRRRDPDGVGWVIGLEEGGRRGHARLIRGETRRGEEERKEKEEQEGSEDNQDALSFSLVSFLHS